MDSCGSDTYNLRSYLILVIYPLCMNHNAARPPTTVDASNAGPHRLTGHISSLMSNKDRAIVLAILDSMSINIHHADFCSRNSN